MERPSPSPSDCRRRSSHSSKEKLKDESSHDQEVEVVKSNLCHRCLTRCFWFMLTSALAVLILFIVMGILVSHLNTEPLNHTLSPWPVTDNEGYYQSYQENGRWVNHWQRDRPSFMEIGFLFIVTSDLSGVSETACSMLGRVSSNIDCNLPVLVPYWMTDKTQHSSELTQFSKKKRVFKDPGVRATWIGHATVLAEVDGYSVLCDPVFSERCSPYSFMGPKRYRKPACKISELPDGLDAVVISHTHYDHMDINSIKQLNDRYGNSLHWYIPNGAKEDFIRSGINAENVHEMVWWEEVTSGRGKNATRIVFTPSNHWSRRGLFDENKALWGSWTVIGKNDSKYWFGGDTAYSDVFEQIGRRYGPFDLSAIPIGAYYPRETMRFVHVDPDEAVKIHEDLRSRRSVGMHWGTFRLTYEYYLEPRTRIEEMVEERGKDENGQDNLQFYTVSVGGTIDGRLEEPIEEKIVEEISLAVKDTIEEVESLN